MRDIVEPILEWYDSGMTLGLATVVNTFRSAPRQPGAAMAVSGGCVEGAVFEAAKEVMATGEPSYEEHGYSDDDAFAVGLTCGGILHVYVEQVNRRIYPSCARSQNR